MEESGRDGKKIYNKKLSREQKQVRADVTTLGTALVEDNMHNGSRTHGVSSNIYGPPTTSYLASKSSEPTF